MVNHLFGGRACPGAEYYGVKQSYSSGNDVPDVHLDRIAWFLPFFHLVRPKPAAHVGGN